MIVSHYLTSINNNVMPSFVDCLSRNLKNRISKIEVSQDNEKIESQSQNKKSESNDRDPICKFL